MRCAWSATGETSESRSLEAELAARDAQLAERDVEMAALQQQVAELTRRVAELTESLGRKSRNSHLPPSSDSPEERRRQRNKAKKAGSTPLSRAVAGSFAIDAGSPAAPAETAPPYPRSARRSLLHCGRALPASVRVRRSFALAGATGDLSTNSWVSDELGVRMHAAAEVD